MTVVFDDYLEALLSANTSAATELLDDALMRGTSPVSLIRDIIGHGQQEIGESWARGSLSAGEEHAASRSHEASRRESDVRDDAASSVPRGGRGRCRATRPIAEQTCPSSPDRQQPRHLKCPIGPISRGGTPRSSVASWQKRTKGPRPCPVGRCRPMGRTCRTSRCGPPRCRPRSTGPGGRATSWPRLRWTSTPSKSRSPDPESKGSPTTTRASGPDVRIWRPGPR